MSGKAKYCQFCGCYIPDNQIICLACGRKYDVVLDNIKSGRGLDSINGTFSAGTQGYSMANYSKSTRQAKILHSDNHDPKATTQVNLNINRIVHEKIDPSVANYIQGLIYYDGDGNKISYVG